MTKFIYSGSIYTTKVQLEERVLMITDTGIGFEVSSEGGSFGHHKTYGKAITFAEKTLTKMVKDN